MAILHMAKTWRSRYDPRRCQRRICVVRVTDLRGIRRSVEVTASSVFEAGALAVAALREDGWSEPIGPATDPDDRGETTSDHAHGYGAADRQLDREPVARS
jgi:hypothetical protein